MARPTVVIAASADAADRPSDRQLATRLTDECGVDVCLVPHLYHLEADHPAARHLRGLTGPLIVAARLFPPATRWILHGLGLDIDGDRVRCLDLRCRPDSREALRDALPPGSHDNGNGRAARQTVFDEAVQPRWYPVLDRDVCTNCRQCHNFCLFEVYELDADGRVQPVRPDNCKPGCPACARVCPAAAIMFPDHADPAIAGDPDAPRQEPQPNVVCTIDPPPDRAAKPTAPTEDLSIDGLIDALEELDDAL